MSAESIRQESREPSEDGVTNRPVVLVCVLLSAFYLASLYRAKYKKVLLGKKESRFQN
jgi:hypothetical protein